MIMEDMIDASIKEKDVHGLMEANLATEEGKRKMSEGDAQITFRDLLLGINRGG